MKLKALALAALAVASLGQAAHAAISEANQGAGELFLSVFDRTAGVSYTLDLGLKIDDVIAGFASPSYSFTAAVNDANFASFLTQVSAGSLEFVVAAGDSVGSAVGSRNLISTVTAGQEDLVANQKNSGLNSGLSYTSAFLGAVNSTGTHLGGYAVNGSSVNVAGTAGYFLEGARDTGGGFFAFQNTNTAGTVAQFVQVSRPGTSNGASTINTVLGIATFDKVGDTYQVSVSAVPEPSTYAMLLGGLGLIGFVARRRAAK